MHTIRDLVWPERAGEPSAAGVAFRAAAALAERVYGPRFAGTSSLTLDEQLAAWRPTAAEDHLVRVVGPADAPLALSTSWLPLLESTDVLDHGLVIDPALPAASRAELAELLVDDVCRVAAARGRAVVMGGSPAAPTGDVMAATGFGGADADDPEAAPLIARGFVLEQVYRVSVADLRRMPDLDARLGAARAEAADYATVAWDGETPAEHRVAMRSLHERMSTDAPIAGLALEPEVWSDERLAEFERSKTAGGRVMRTVAVRHEPSGELVGFTSLFIGSGDVARQHDTLVVREHRGHGLGMLLKLANLVELRERHPTHPRVSTWNAEENRHMLAVNEATGFEPVAYEGVWQRKERS